MKVALIVDQPHWTGIGTYAVALKDLLSRYIDEVKLFYVGAVEDDISSYEPTPYLRRTRLLILRPSTIRYNYRKIVGDSSLDGYLLHYLGTDFYPLKYKRGVITIHDLIRDKFDFSFSFHPTKLLDYLERYRKFKQNLKLYPSSTGIVAISKKTMNDIKIETGLDSTIIHHWIANEKFKERSKDQAIRQLDLDPDLKYILSVGNDRKTKRLDLVKMFSDMLPQNYKLIKIGAPIESINALNVKQVSDDKYPMFFDASEALVHLSEDEGFGRPMIEAISSGIPVICREKPINVELMGGSAIYVKERFTKEDVGHIVEDLDHTDFRIRLGDRINVQRKMFNVDDAARKYVDFYKRYYVPTISKDSR